MTTDDIHTRRRKDRKKLKKRKRTEAKHQRKIKHFEEKIRRQLLHSIIKHVEDREEGRGWKRKRRRDGERNCRIKVRVQK